MEDIAVLTGAKFFSEDIGIPLANIRLEDLGKAEKVVVGKHETTILGGAGSSEDIENRARSVRIQIEIAGTALEREKLQERLAKLLGSLAVLKAGRPLGGRNRRRKVSTGKRDAFHPFGD